MRVGAAGEHDVVAHRRRSDDPGDLVIDAPAQLAVVGTDRVEEAIAGADVHDTIVDGRRRLDAAPVETVGARLEGHTFGLELPTERTTPQVVAVDAPVVRS